MKIKYLVAFVFAIGFCFSSFSIAYSENNSERSTEGVVSGGHSVEPSEGLQAADSMWKEAVLQPVAIFEDVVGTLQPKTSTVLSSKMMGTVKEVLKREGEMVKAGELLVKINLQELASDMEGAKASLNESQAASSEIQSHIQNARLAKESAVQDMNLAEVSFQRIKGLYEKKSVTQQEFDQANTRYLQSKNAVNQAESQIVSLKAKLSQISARSDAARAGIRKVSTYQEYSEVKAPFDGRIISRKAEPGMMAAPGVPLLTIEDTGRIRFEAIVPERLLGFLPEGTTIDVKIDALDGETIQGTVVEISPGADLLSHTFIAKISIPEDSRLRTGMYTRGSVKKGEEKLLLVPVTALEYRGQLEGVYIKSNDKTLFRLVKTGRKYGDQVEVLSGLNMGEIFAVTPLKQ
jgi:multidrug efflux pump subunit AcrA (membrane-fusion protein)